MIRSMTAFARRERVGEWATLVWELRSVNQRFLEITPRLPEELRDLETAVRERVSRGLQRGKIECRLRYHPGPEALPDIKVNRGFAKQLADATREIDALLYNSAPINAMDILQWPGVIAVGDAWNEPLREEALALLEEALRTLVATREREGERLREFVEQRLTAMDQQISRVKAGLPAATGAIKDRTLRRLAELQVEVDEARLNQELALLLLKMDIAEEVERLETHVGEARRVLKGGGAVGRRLDFLMQELHREANTLGVKAADTETADAALEVKVLVEQAREQVQNIE
jgi:uncharacterized protein (TIGR00255 family)